MHLFLSLPRWSFLYRKLLFVRRFDIWMTQIVSMIISCCELVKSPDPVQNVCSPGILVIKLIVNILRSWHQGFWNSRWLVRSWYSCHLWLYSRFGEPHQWWWALHLWSLLGIVSSVPLSIGEEVMSEAREIHWYIQQKPLPSINCKITLGTQT